MIVVGTLRPMVNEEERRGTMIKSHELVRVIVQSSEALASEIKEKPRATNLFVISECPSLFLNNISVISNYSSARI